MAANVRVTGPELLVEVNRRALLRIEESIRQYSAHSRESIYLVRRPFHHSQDHIALLSVHGIALVEMVPMDGLIRGSASGPWRSEEPSEENITPAFTARSRPERHSETFPNPFQTLDRMRAELGDELRSNRSSAQKDATPVATIALFTGGVQSMHVEGIADQLFSTLTLEDALARSIMHRPNILRASETPSASYSNEALEEMFNVLVRSAEYWEEQRKTESTLGPAPVETVSSASRTTRRHSPYWLVLVLVALAAFTFIMIRVVLIRSNTAKPPPPPPPVKHTPSEIVVQTPIEVELFISPFQFPSREQLDRALTYGEGMRFLPDSEQVVVMDSLSLARGVYGYFKVEETWRKGMLLQTLHHADTIQIVKFLDPLPYTP